MRPAFGTTGIVGIGFSFVEKSFYLLVFLPLIRLERGPFDIQAQARGWERCEAMCQLWQKGNWTCERRALFDLRWLNWAPGGVFKDGRVFYENTSWLRASSHPLAGYPLTGLAPLGPFKKVYIFSQKKALKNTKKVPQKDFALRPGPYRESLGFLSFSKLYPLGGGTQKKYFEVTHRVQGEAHAKFGWDPSCGSGSKSEQTDRQTDRQTGLFYIYIDRHRWERVGGGESLVNFDTGWDAFRNINKIFEPRLP